MDFSLTVGVIGILGVILCGSILASLLLILKKKTWESHVKWLGLALAISTALTSLTCAAINLSTPPAGLCRVNVFFEACWGALVLLYFNTLLFALLLQVSAPIIPERWKHTQRYIPKALYTEIILHTTVFILTLLISIVTISAVQNCCNLNVVFLVFVLISLALSALILVFTIFIFGVFFHKFHRIRVVTTTTKRAVIKLSVVFIIVVFCIPLIIVPTRIEQKLIVAIFDPTVVGLSFLLPLIMVIYMYLPSTQCCKCYKRTPRQLPLLPNTEIHTTPLSEWDHSNVPSITVSVHPNEMSDCETDHMSGLTIPAPKYGSTT